MDLIVALFLVNTMTITVIVTAMQVAIDATRNMIEAMSIESVKECSMVSREDIASIQDFYTD